MRIGRLRKSMRWHSYASKIVTRCYSSKIGASLDPFEVLGVSTSSSDLEIKQRFYQLAKQHHPDMTQHSLSHKVRSLGYHLKASLVDFSFAITTSSLIPLLLDEQREFLRIVQAYEILSDPVLRANYVLRHRPSHRAAAQNRGVEGDSAKGFDAKARFNETLRQRRRGYGYHRYEPSAEKEESASRRRRREGGGAGDDNNSWLPSMNDTGLLESLEEEFDAALLHAFLGPRVDSEAIPHAFEAEERIRPSGEDLPHEHILELTSGQQVLGWVTAAASLHLGGLVAHGDDKREGWPLLHYWDGLTSMEAASNYLPLDLIWADKTVARSIRGVDRVSGDDVILIQTQLGEVDKPVMSGKRGKVWNQCQSVEEHLLTSCVSFPLSLATGNNGGMFAIRGLNKAGLISRHTVENLEKRQATHTLITHKTPGGEK